MDRISMITALFSRALVLKSIGGDSLKYIGVTTTALTDGATTNPITIDGDTVTATNGNVALYSGDAFVFNGTIWQASSAISQIFTEIGDLSDLDTEVKTDLVSAINEVNEEKQDDVELSLTPTAVVSDRDIIDGQGNTLSVLAEALTKTASGNPVLITDCAGGKARSLITEINAIQDLHGYDHPWAGGAGKNKIENILQSGSSGNITWAVDGQGIITVSGYSESGVIERTVGEVTLAAGDYKLNGGEFPTGHVRLQLKLKSGGSAIASAYDNLDVAFTVSESSTYVLSMVVAPVTITGTTKLKPMIRLSTESDASFAPYSNICPISGRSSVVVNRSDGDEISEDFTIQLGTTVYGADINWDTGVMTVKHKYKDITKRDIGDNGTTGGLIEVYVNGTSDKANGPTNMLCNPLTVGSTAAAYVIRGRVTSANVTFCLPTDVTSDFEAVKTWVDNNPIQLVYALANPTTIQLTPTQLELLKGYNRVTIESGTITLDYIAKAISGNDEEIAPLVGDKATKAYAVNDFIERNDGLYRVTAPIASGASFTANNTVKMSIGEALTYLYNK